MDQNRVKLCVEQLCEKGCTDVLDTIIALEKNQAVAETLNLSSDEILAVLSELKSIMAIYRE